MTPPPVTPPPVTIGVERLTQRVADAPAVFLEPLTGPGAPDLRAVIADLFRDRATQPLAADEGAPFRPEEPSPARTRHLQLVLLAAWLLHDPAFAGAAHDALLSLLQKRLASLANAVVPRKFFEDDERREELVRTCLAALGLLPPGETAAVAEDRLAALDSVRRRALLREAKKQEGAREAAREAERERRRKELEVLRAQEEEERRKAARTTHED